MENVYAYLYGICYHDSIIRAQTCPQRSKTSCGGTQDKFPRNQEPSTLRRTEFLEKTRGAKFFWQFGTKKEIQKKNWKKCFFQKNQSKIEKKLGGKTWKKNS